MYIKLKLGAFCGLLLLIVMSHAQAQVSFTGTTLTQNFDTLPNASNTTFTFVNNSTIVGWYSSQTANNGYRSSTGQSNAAEGKSFGAANATDRALGGLTGTGVASIIYGVQLRNTSGSTIDLRNLLVSYTGEQWNSSGTNSQTLALSFLEAGAVSTNQLTATGYTSNGSLNFVSPITNNTGQLDGNLAANRTSISAPLTATSTNWNNNNYLWIRWSQTSGTNNNQGLSIDNLSVSVIPEPGTLVFFCLSGMGVFVKRRKNNL
jgi:hypothetical protein